MNAEPMPEQAEIAPPPSRVGPLLRQWRQRRGVSQLDLALEAGVSARHISFVETGRSRPSAEMVMQLAEALAVPLRDRNQLLLAAGYAPVYGQRGLDEPEMKAVRDALEQIVAGHGTHPAVVVDRHWGLVTANHAFTIFTEGIDGELLEPPVNVLRLALSPEGAAPRIVNFPQLRTALLQGLARQAISTGDPALLALHEELSGLPGDLLPLDQVPDDEVAIPFRYRWGGRELSFISTLTTFARATDVTVAELAIEAFHPTDDLTAAALAEYASGA